MTLSQMGEEARPRYIVWVNLPTSQLATADAERFLFDETDRLIDRSYRLELVVRSDAQGGQPAANRFAPKKRQ